MTAEQAHEILRRVSDEDCITLGLGKCTYQSIALFPFCFFFHTSRPPACTARLDDPHPPPGPPSPRPPFRHLRLCQQIRGKASLSLPLTTLGRYHLYPCEHHQGQYCPPATDHQGCRTARTQWLHLSPSGIQTVNFLVERVSCGTPLADCSDIVVPRGHPGRQRQSLTAAFETSVRPSSQKYCRETQGRRGGGSVFLVNSVTPIYHIIRFCFT